MNLRNEFKLIGRLTDDPVVFENTDGSKKVRLTLAVKDNFSSKDGQKGSQFLPCEGFISADAAAKNGLGLYDKMHKGDMVAVSGQIQNNNWTGKDGTPHYELVLHIETREMLESKAVTEQRQVNRAVAADAERVEG